MCETIHRTDKTNDDMATSLHIKPDNQVDKEFRPPSSGQICVKWASELSTMSTDARIRSRDLGHDKPNPVSTQVSDHRPREWIGNSVTAQSSYFLVQ